MDVCPGGFFGGLKETTDDETLLDLGYSLERLENAAAWMRNGIFDVMLTEGAHCYV